MTNRKQVDPGGHEEGDDEQIEMDCDPTWTNDAGGASCCECCEAALCALQEVHEMTCDAITQVGCCGQGAGETTASADADARTNAQLVGILNCDLVRACNFMAFIASRVRQLDTGSDSGGAAATGGADTKNKIADDIMGELTFYARCRCIVNPGSGKVECWDPDYNNGQGGFNPDRNDECGLP